MIRNFFVFYEDILSRRTFLVNQEARMQLVLQNVLIIYQVRNIFMSLGKHEKIKYVKFPMIEFHYEESDYLGKISPSTRWIGGILLQILTSLTSTISATLAVAKVCESFTKQNDI